MRNDFAGAGLAQQHDIAKEVAVLETAIRECLPQTQNRAAGEATSAVAEV